MTYLDAGTPVEVLSDLSFELESGKSLAVLGRSGIGKTTLLYLLGGLERPSSGHITVGDLDLTDCWEHGKDLAQFRRENMGFVFQFHHLLPEFDALENVAMPLRISGGVSAEEAESAAEALLERVGLKRRLSPPPGNALRRGAAESRRCQSAGK